MTRSRDAAYLRDSIIKRVAFAALATLGFCIAQPTWTQAQPYPSRSVTVVVALAAGTGMDTIARLYSQKLSERLGRSVVVENRLGAGQNVAVAHVAASPPDGNTLLVSSAAPMAVNPSTYKKLPFDPQRDFIPIAIYAKTGFIIIVNPQLPIHNISDLASYSKSSDKPISFGAAGRGGIQNLIMEMIRQRFDFKMTIVPYRNSPQSIADVAAGHLNVAIAETGASLPLIQQGKVRAIAVTDTERMPLLPDVPTIAEAPKGSGFEGVSWHSLVAPAKTPRAIVDRLHAEMKQIMAQAEMKKRIASVGLMPFEIASIEEMQRYMLAERKKWNEAARLAGVEGSQ